MALPSGCRIGENGDRRDDRSAPTMLWVSTSGPADGEGDPFAEMAEVFNRFVNSFGSSPQLDFEQARQMAAGIANEGQSEFNVDPMHRIRVEQIARVAELH